MCGIVGFWSNFRDEVDNQINIKKMSEELNHRGPDYGGYWNDNSESFYLSHRRLSILDLSIAGNQPMLSHSGRFVISFNGEIYNHIEIKKFLKEENKEIKWRGHSDTEILVELIESLGLEKALSKCVGMFALAIWDRKEKCLQLARDRVGEKPLYYGFSEINGERTFLFASELSAIKKWKYFNNGINPEALSELINYQSISAPNSIYKNIYQLMPGHFIKINSPNEYFLDSSKSWWELTSTIEKAIENPINDKSQAIKLIENTLKNSVKIQSIADVPLGTFLSGGVDSSLITALLQSQLNRKVKTYTIGFEEQEFNEAPFSKEIAKFLDTDHNEFYLTSKDAQDLIPKLSEIYSEPFADASQLPTHLVCREAKNSGLTVALSGDGGDELFGGYNRYFLGEKIWKRIGFAPFYIRRLIGKVGTKLPEKNLDGFFKPFGLNQIGNKIKKLSDRLTYIKDQDDFYFSLISQWKDPNFLFEDDFVESKIFNLPETLLTKIPSKFSNDLTAKMMIYDALHYLPNDILTKIDRASMAIGFETRAPFLDHRVIEAAWKLEMNLKINSKNIVNSNKWVLREILYKYVPKHLIERPKAGFAIPLSDWLRGPLKTWAGDLLSKDNIIKDGYFKPFEISTLWQEHLSCRKDNSSKLWPIIMWQSWLEKNS
jgi:asparagine synthase (glutamine-hydrolysing)